MNIPVVHGYPWQTEPHRGEATCLDSSSSQLARPGLELRPANSERHSKKTRGLLEGEQTRVSLEGAQGVMGSKIDKDEFIYNPGTRHGSLVFTPGQCRGKKELGFRTRSLGAGKRKEEEGGEPGWRLPQ